MALGVITVQSAKHYELLGGLLMFYPWLGIIIPFFIIGFYMAYQIFDNDDPVEKVSDLIEYSIGLIVGLIL